MDLTRNSSSFTLKYLDEIKYVLIKWISLSNIAIIKLTYQYIYYKINYYEILKN